MRRVADARNSSLPGEERMKLLLLTTRNLSGATGEWRLIAERARALMGLGVETDLIYLRKNADLSQVVDLALWTDESWAPSGKWALVSPIALVEALRRTNLWLETHRQGKVIVSGVELYPIVPLLPKNRTIVDLHGTLEEWKESEGRTVQSHVLKCAFPIAARLEAIALCRCWGALTASGPLREYALQRGGQHAWLIPCGISHARAFEPSSRNEWRRKLGLRDEEVAFVYSGGLSAWQCLAEAIQLVRQFRQAAGSPTRLVILTPNPERAAALSRRNGEVAVVLSVKAAEVLPALRACDIGLMLREPNQTNHYAFPNKFAEYVSAGLFIISSKGLTSPAQIIVENRIGLLIDPAEVRAGLSHARLVEVTRACRDALAQVGRYDRLRVVLDRHLLMGNLVSEFVEGLKEGCQR